MPHEPLSHLPSAETSACYGATTTSPIIQNLLKLSRRFHIYDTNYDTDCLDQEKFFWRPLEDMGVEAMVRVGERLSAEEMFWEDAGTGTRMCRRLGIRFSRRWNEQASHYDGSEAG